MDRRAFLKASAGMAAAGTVASGEAASAFEPKSSKAGPSRAPAILAAYTTEDHRSRLENIAFFEQRIHKCLRKHLITDYLPGQCNYNLGEYPCRKPWDPDDWDEQELDRLQEHGIQLIHVMEEWNDSQRLFGGHKLDALNPKGFRRFVEMVHRRGMKLIVYASAAFFDRRDPDFQRAWARDQDLVEIYFQYARCSPASSSWRAYLLPRLLRILDEYDVDGFYNDYGYIPLAGNPHPPTKDEVLAFEETATHDGALEDLLALIYAEVKRRGGIVKLHLGGVGRPHTSFKLYDYLWVGEGVRNGDSLCEAVKDYSPYVVPCLDMSRARIAREDELYLHAIPYMQFPLLLAGRPFTGERAMIPGVKYQPEETCFWTRHNRAIWRYYQAHPEGARTYGWWDSVPGRPEAQPTHARWLRRYLPLVEEGSWAWLEIGESDLFRRPLPTDVVASAFANRELHLVLANYGRDSAVVETGDSYISITKEDPLPGKRWELPARSLQILRRGSLPG